MKALAGQLAYGLNPFFFFSFQSKRFISERRAQITKPKTVVLVDSHHGLFSEISIRLFSRS